LLHIKHRRGHCVNFIGIVVEEEEVQPIASRGQEQHDLFLLHSRIRR